jgi:hypothetical protein
VKQKYWYEMDSKSFKQRAPFRQGRRKPLRAAKLAVLLPLLAAQSLAPFTVAAEQSKPKLNAYLKILN